MIGRKHHTECPVCGSREINPLLTVRDFSVSKEDYVIWQCAACSLRFTQDAPDENSIGPYYKSPDYISHTNTDKGFINHTYQKVRNHTLQQKAGLVTSRTGVEKGRILDVGCGTGAFLNVMRDRGWEIEGIEPDYDARQLVKELYHIEPKEPGAIVEIPNGSLDAITLWHVLEHVHELHPYVEKLKELLKPGGRLFIAVPNYQSEDAKHYKPFWAAYDVPRHLYHFSPKSMEVLMRRHGLKIIEKKPMWFDSFYISLLSSKYHAGKTRYFSAFYNGLRSNFRALMNRDKCSSVIYIISKA